jgi:hypothetical protein
MNVKPSVGPLPSLPRRPEVPPRLSPPTRRSAEAPAGSVTIVVVTHGSSARMPAPMLPPLERTNKHAFLRELCLALQVPAPGGGSEERYVFDREVRFTPPGAAEVRGVIDLYREGCFVLQVQEDRSGRPLVPGPRRGRAESWHNAMERTRAEAIELARHIRPPPPFVVVCNPGRCFDLYACFDGSGRYRPFPDGEANRLSFRELGRYAQSLRALWMDPCSQDPSRRAEHLAEEAAATLAPLAEALRAAGHPPEVVADFVLDCLFALAADDFGLLPGRVFRETLGTHWLVEPEAFPEGFARLWRAMGDVFAGRPFEPPRAMPLGKPHLQQLLAAASIDWSQVDPAVLGGRIAPTLDPRKQGFGGRWFTSRASVGRLVQAAVEAPLRADWDAVRAEVWLCRARDDLDAAARALHGFRERLAGTRVLDPACGTGDFLCAALRFLQDLDVEARGQLRSLGEAEPPDAGLGPAQLRGIEIDALSVKIARLMIWLTALRRRVRAHDRKGSPALLLPWELSSIEHRDSLLSWDAAEPLLDGRGRPVALRRRDAQATNDPTAVSVEPYVQYSHPRRAEWPAADFIVGNPPFMGPRAAPIHLSEGYVAALGMVYPEVPNGADLAAYWWSRAAALTREGAIRRFGFILPSTFGTVARSALDADIEAPEKRVRILLAAPDQRSDGHGSVRVSMVVAQRASEALPSHALLLGIDDSSGSGVSYRAVPEIDPSLRARPGVGSVQPLAANAGLFFRGVWLCGSGFLLRPGDGSVEHAENPATHLPVVRPYLTGRDLMGRREGSCVIDFHGLDAARAQAVSPELFQRVLRRVRPERERQARASLRERWWQLGNDSRAFRQAVKDVHRYIATSQIAKHRVFVLLDHAILPDTTLACLALDDAHFLGVLSSRVHTLWASTAGGSLAGASRYDAASCFEPFPFPACTELSRRAIREVAEALDAHRKERLAREPDLTLTEMYNVLSMQRSGIALAPRGGRRRSTASIAVLRQLHDELDHAVLDAYGWPRDISDEDLLQRLVSLNRDRAREEQAGLVRWLRPGFQSGGPSGDIDRPPRAESPAEKGVEDALPPLAKGLSARIPWPATRSEQIVCVRDLVATASHAWSTTEIASVFKGVKKRAVAEVLDGLAAAGVLRASGPAAQELRWSLVEGGWT